MLKSLSVNFFCPDSFGHLVINHQDGPRLCTQANSWFTTGEYDPNTNQVTVDQMGYCPTCGALGQSRVPDKYAGVTVVVRG